MTSLKLIGAAAIAVSALAGPAFGQAAFSNPDACEAQFPGAQCENMGAGSPYATSAQQRQYRRTAYRQGDRRAYRQGYRDAYGYGPAGAAAAAVGTAAAVTGAAVGTAGAIATAPFRGWGNAYAYDNSYGYNGGYARGQTGWNGDWASYAARNGIVCRPGTMF